MREEKTLQNSRLQVQRQDSQSFRGVSITPPIANKTKRLHMDSVYLVVIVHENGTIWVHSVHGTMEGAEVMMEKCRAENGKDDYGLHFDFCHIVKRPFSLY